jgi:hypothetical protein
MRSSAGEAGIIKDVSENELRVLALIQLEAGEALDQALQASRQFVNRTLRACHLDYVVANPIAR